MRIELRSVLIILLFSKHLKPSAIARLFIGNGGRNSHANFRASPIFAPEVQSRAHPFRPLIHARQSPMTSATVIFQDFGVDSLGGITYKQKKSIIVITEFVFDVLRVCVAVSISQQLSRDSMDLIP